jgi:biopolymer transport protein ExbD
MGATVGTSDDKGVDVEINVVPFIDLMSCLTAFLLVTAVWSQFAQINIKPKGLGKDATKDMDEKIEIYASVLLTTNEIWVGLTVGDRRQIANTADGYDWVSLQEALETYKDEPAFENRQDIEVAAEDDVAYQSIIDTMDRAVATGFRDIGFVDPSSLSVKFKE